jgi:hypothetical protein
MYPNTTKQTTSFQLSNSKIQKTMIELDGNLVLGHGLGTDTQKCYPNYLLFVFRSSVVKLI